MSVVATISRIKSKGFEIMKKELKYIPPEKVKKIEKELEKIGELEFEELFNQRSFKSNGVMYDFLLETDNFLSLLTQDFLKIKKLFSIAAIENNFIVTTVS